MPSLEQVLRATSRTFALGIEGLPHPLREEMRVAYLILRVSDYLEDNTTLDESRKSELLDSWALTLEGGGLEESLQDHLDTTDDPSPDSMAAHHVSEILQALGELPPQAQEVIRKHTRDSTLGMSRWVRRGPDIDTEEDLDDYMHEVAGRVGYLITELFSLVSGRVKKNKEEMMALGREFGLALQTVNVVRGIPSDIKRGWFFVPRGLLPESVGTPQAFLAEENQTDAVAVVDQLLSKASRHFGAAEEYVSHLPPFQGKMRFFCLLPFFFGVRTVALSRGNPRVLVSEVKLDRAEVRAIAARTKLMGWSNRWVHSYARRLGVAPGTRPSESGAA
jgi:farnesyl-diphosphate farnesyltransferase